MITLIFNYCANILCDRFRKITSHPYCSECGNRTFAVSNCTKCGYPISLSEKFCPDCGTSNNHKKYLKFNNDNKKD